MNLSSPRASRQNLTLSQRILAALHADIPTSTPDLVELVTSVRKRNRRALVWDRLADLEMSGLVRRERKVPRPSEMTSQGQVVFCTRNVTVWFLAHPRGPTTS